MAYSLGIYLETKNTNGKVILKSYSRNSDLEEVYSTLDEEFDIPCSYDGMKYFELTSYDLDKAIEVTRNRIETIKENKTQEEKELTIAIDALAKNAMEQASKGTNGSEINNLVRTYITGVQELSQDYSGYRDDSYEQILQNTINELDWYRGIITSFRAGDDDLKLYCAIY